jgi:UDP-N-acetyl-D-glucosamine dehydrogenase
LLGVAYKRDVDDPRESPAFELLELLAERGAVLSYSDPHVPVLPAMRRRPALSRASIDWESRELTADYLSAQDLVIIVTDHSAFDYDQIVRHSRLIVDTRNATARVAEGREKILKA